MVSKARLDLPDPDSPVMTISALRGSSRWRSLRLCSRAPETAIFSAAFTDLSLEPAPAEHLFGTGRVRPLYGEVGPRPAAGARVRGHEKGGAGRHATLRRHACCRGMRGSGPLEGLSRGLQPDRPAV